MKTKVLWTFPVPSTQQSDAVDLFYLNGDIWLQYEFYYTANDEHYYHSFIKFDGAFNFRHTSDYAIEVLPDCYDEIVEILDSEWLYKFKRRDKDLADRLRLKHYAIYLDSNGLFEFLASGFKAYEVIDGKKVDFYSSAIPDFDL